MKILKIILKNRNSFTVQQGDLFCLKELPTLRLMTVYPEAKKTRFRGIGSRVIFWRRWRGRILKIDLNAFSPDAGLKWPHFTCSSKYKQFEHMITAFCTQKPVFLSTPHKEYDVKIEGFYLDRLITWEAHFSLHSFAVGMVLIGLWVRIFRGYLRTGNLSLLRNGRNKSEYV